MSFALQGRFNQMFATFIPSTNKNHDLPSRLLESNSNSQTKDLIKCLLALNSIFRQPHSLHYQPPQKNAAVFHNLLLNIFPKLFVVGKSSPSNHRSSWPVGLGRSTRRTGRRRSGGQAGPDGGRQGRHRHGDGYT